MLDAFSLKILMVAAAAVAVFLLARFFSASAEERVHAAPPLSPAPEAETPSSAKIPAVGSEILFPFDIRELEASYGPDFFRPIVRNYWFRQTDLAAGPADASSFCDEFFIEFEHPQDGYRWRDTYTVATASGIAADMGAEREDARWADGTLIVKRYDLAAILRAVMERYAQSGGASSAAGLQAAQRSRAPEIA